MNLKPLVSIISALFAIGLAATAENPKDFTVQSPTHGTTFTLSEAKGQVVALHFLLKTECPFCLKHTHDYAAQAASMPGVADVFLKPDSDEEIKKWASHLDRDQLTDLPIIYRDPDANLAQAFGVPNGYPFHGQTVHFPALVVLDGTGKELFRYVGKSNADRMSVADFKKKLGEAKGAVPQVKVTPAEWVRQQIPPRFKPGHTLPHLGQMHCINPPVELRAELARNWGFAVRLNRPQGEPELIRLCKENPTMFKPAAMIGNLANLESSKSIPWPEGTFLRKADGSLVDGKQIFSPEMPEAAWLILVDGALRQIEGQLGGLPASSLATVENWTEHGINVPINVKNEAQHDPRVVAAKGDRSWQDYVSQRKAYYEGKMREAVKHRYPKAFYTCYTYGGFTGKPDGDWAWDFHHLKTATDLPSPECYFNYFNSGFVGGKDMLTLRLYARHIEIQEGSPHYLGWLCAGYQRKIADYQGDTTQGMYSDLPRWMGYLKMSYLAGMLGGITTGEFGCEVRYEPFDPAQPPKWLDQMLTVSHAHALFSWIEADLRNSQLLPGPQPHAWNKDQPAYEFPTGYKNTRVLVRRINGASRWLIGAWAADGIEREVIVTVPGLGDYRLRARPAGTVHWIEQVADKGKVTWLDPNAMQPSLSLQP
ncbi:MAG TPA: redoxin domain-containing protein [Candidatus Paceibacterota bacterium]|nr:redoxin domain-containing protein [Verrucomicrobiota bacterium]HRY50131.1 redoxin domain-containing protein [Candidatus Paceibacterota bacterium]HRZ57183.1 redoxin domain-containing protein [Candidatus Paceibacterota bacterium]